MTDQSINWISLLIQIPLAGLVVFLTIRFLEHLKQIQDQYQTTIKEMHKETLTFAADQANVNREFLKVQREQMNESIARLAEELKTTRLEVIREIINERRVQTKA